MPTSVVKEGGVWIIRGDTRPIKDVLLEAGATWQGQRVRWEFAGETLPEVIQAALDGRAILPATVPAPKPFPIYQQYQRLRAEHPDHLLLFQLGDHFETYEEQAQQAADLLDLVITHRPINSAKERVSNAGFPVHALEKMLAKLTSVKVAVVEQMSDRQGDDGLIERKVTRVIEPSPVGEPDWDKLTSVLLDLRDVLRESSDPRISFYSVVVPKKVETRKKALKALIDADAVGIAQYNTSATRWSILWSTGTVEIMDVADLELASEERRAKLLPAVEGATVLYASKKTASRGTLRRLKPSGKWEIELEGGTLASEYDKGVIVLAHPRNNPKDAAFVTHWTREVAGECWWIDEDNSIFRDDDPVPEHFAILRGPFTSQSAAEKALWVQVQG